MAKIILGLWGAIGLFGTNVGRLIGYTVLNKVTGPLDTAVHFVGKTLLMAKITVVLTLLPFAVGIAVGRFGLSAGATLAGIIAAISLAMAAVRFVQSKSAATTEERLDRQSEAGGWSVVMLLTAGAAIGLATSSANQETVGQGFIAVASLVGAVGFAVVFRFQAVIGLETFGLVAKTGRSLSKRVPKLRDDFADRTIKWISGYCAWATFIALLAQIVPLYRNLGILAFVATCLILLAAAVSADWTGAASFRKVAVGFAFAGAAIGLLGLSFPEEAATVRARFGFGLEKRTVITMAGNAEKAANLEALKRLTEEKAQIERALVNDCQGRFQGPCQGDDSRYQEVVRLITLAEEDLFIRHQAGIEEKTVELPEALKKDIVRSRKDTPAPPAAPDVRPPASKPSPVASAPPHDATGQRPKAKQGSFRRLLEDLRDIPKEVASAAF